MCLVGISFKNIKKIDNNALDHDRTTMINGFFVGLILFSHFNGYVALTGLDQTIYLKLFYSISQLMVTTFLFYSGYGIIESIKKKPDYIKHFFKNRFLKLFIMFAIANCLFIILNLVLGIKYPISTTLLAFTGWTSIGNSNWFIFVTFVLYLFILLAFNVFKKDNKKATLLTLLLTLIYIIIMAKTRVKGGIWYNTILCFNLGMYISLYKEQILKYLKDNTTYIMLVLSIFLVFVLCHFQNYHYIVYELHSLLFVLLVFLLSLKIKFGNKILFFLGKNTFGIYILQRLSYIAYRAVGLRDFNMYLYFVVSILTTLILAVLFNKLLKLIFKPLKIKA
jgi:membrane-bound acyltransferase YfiQ involved in biofilm formation